MMKKGNCFENQQLQLRYDPDEMECVIADRVGKGELVRLKLRIPLVCTCLGERIAFMLSVVRWKSTRRKGGVCVTFWLEAEKDPYGISPALKYELFLPDQTGYVEENAILKVDKTIELHSFSIPWHIVADTKVQYLPIPFADSDQKPGMAPLKDYQEGTCLYEGLLLGFSGYGLVAARVPKDQRPQWIAMSKDSLGRISIAGIQAGLIHKSDSEKEEYHPLALTANQAFSFLKTRYLFYAGEEREGLYLYRDFMKEKGLCIPERYRPPFQYCIYYEYPGYFQKEEVIKAADLAASLGCTLLYTDQGWETYFGNGIWDEPRLGEAKALVEQLSQKGLGLGVLVGMHLKAFCMPEDVYRRNRRGEINNGDPWHSVGVCAQSRIWQRRKKRRLKRLALQGISFMSFDFHNYENICYSREHAHTGPSDEWGHAVALARLQTELKKECPNLLIEAHDWINAGTYTYPVYLFPQACHERWGFEYMWKPFEDFKTGRLRNLYYYNMAYEKPLYLHIDLADDSDRMAVFWYIASTVRHLGIGNFTGVKEEHKEICRSAIGQYCKIREYLVNGTFWGIHPLIHVHELEEKGLLLLLFQDRDEKRRICLRIPGKTDAVADGRFAKVTSIWGSVPEIGVKDGDILISVLLDGYDVNVLWLPHLCDAREIELVEGDF